jgi:hypothetical protein
VSREYRITSEFTPGDAAGAMAKLFPGIELDGYILIGFDGSERPHILSNAASEGLIIAGLAAVLYGLTRHELTGEPAAPMDVLEIPYRTGAQTVSLACPQCGSIGWARTPAGIDCAGCGESWGFDEIMAMIERKQGEAG